MVVQSPPVPRISFDSADVRAKRVLDIGFTLLMLPIVGIISAIIAVAVHLD